MTDEACNPRKMPVVQPGDEVVISGIAGRFPESDNVKRLQENLMSKRDLITDDERRWKHEHPEIPQRTGKINNIEKFDAPFFAVRSKQAHKMDPMCRMILEHAYEAVVDAGVNPRQLRGSRTGVFVGSCFSESENTLIYDILQVDGFGLVGCAHAMLSNRISYWLGVTGPSCTIDTACSSSLNAVENAYRAIHDGLCDAAIVGGSNLCLHPLVSLQFSKFGVLSMDGRCKVFDESANGYVRSESVSAIFLQKAKDAKRIYATVVHGKVNCDGFKEQGFTFPSSRMQATLLRECYLECGISPTLVNYVEAHGTGTKVGDPEEVNAIDAVFCPGRKTPLMIGSCKSNFGHTEPASGMSSIAKVIIAMESGIIPPNLHYKHPRKGIKALEDGRIKVVTDLTPWEGGYAGISSFGFGGANAHILLKSNTKQKVNNGAPDDNLMRLVIVSGRTEEAVSTIINDLNSKPVDVEYISLLHSLHLDDISGHLYRGYTLLPARGITENLKKEIKYFPGVKRPVWFVFSGMGSQWPGMGEALLRLPVFAAAIQKCHAVLEPHGIDIFHVITNKDKTAFDNILYSFIGIAAIQIGLVDVLRSLGIEPDNVIGHSFGELGCAYADGCFTAEQMIMSAYSRGLVSIETKFIHGSMATIGLDYTELKKLCPADIEIACHNAAMNSTISGPADSMKAFVAQLQAKNIFAKEVRCGNIPYHSRYISQAGPKLLAYLKKLIPDPKPRSSKWLSTSVPFDKWGTPEAWFSSAEYHTNNFLGSVLFKETSAFIPKDAITIEIAPHGLFQSILRNSLNTSVANIALTQRDHHDNVEVLLQSIGKMYIVGLHPQLNYLYPHVEFPVSRGTQMISPLVKWEHSEDWFVTSCISNQKNVSGERIVKVSLSNSNFEPMIGHVIDGRNLFPATGYLVLVWESIGIMRCDLYTQVPIVFENVRFLRATTIPKEGAIEFTVSVHKGTGRFEIVEGGMAVVTGYVRACSNAAVEKTNPPIIDDGREEFLSSSDVYKELRICGYQYTGVYRSIIKATSNGSKAHIAWNNDWVSFLDNMLQIKILGSDTRGLFVPTGIKKLVIDTTAHLSQLEKCEEENNLPAYVNKLFSAITCGGVEIRGLKVSAIARRKPAGDPVLEEYKFIAHHDRAEVNLHDIARLITQIGLENHLGIKIKTIELIEKTDKVLVDNLLSPAISESLEDIPLIQTNISIVSTKDEFEDGTLPSDVSVINPKKVNADTNALLAIGHRLFTKDRADNLKLLLLGLQNGGFLLTREVDDEVNNIEMLVRNKGLDVILEKKSRTEVFILLRKNEKILEKTEVVYVDNNKLDWVKYMRKTMSEQLKINDSGSVKILFVGQGDFDNGLMGLINCLRKEPGGEVVRGLLIQDCNAPKFSLENPFYSKQLQKDLAVCVLRENGTWGTYRHLPLPPLEMMPVQHASVNQTVQGDLSSLNWLEGPLQLDTENIVNIVYSSINFKDIMLATGKLASGTVRKIRLLQECVLGCEYSGINAFGKRIMGIIENNAISNLCMVDNDLAWEIPNSWTLEDAATVPCVYSTCYYALYKRGKMQKADKVLIHAGSGGVGQAAINLSLHEGCEVFTTVGTPEKRRFIREHFPQIPDDHIGNSRDTSFEKMIILQTNGRGVDIVLNSLAEEKLQASVACLAYGGRFLEIGKFDLSSNNSLGMECFLREISFQGVMLDHLITSDYKSKLEVHKLVANGIKSGAIKPLIRTVFPKDQIEAAFRYMAAGKHIGKVLVKVHEENEQPNSLPMALPRYYCLSNRSYIILGGLGGFGLELADWLVLRGARNLVLTSRTGVRNGYQRMRIELWESYGTKVVIVTEKDASKREDCRAIVETAARLAPVDGIFNLAVVLKDALWDNQTPESFAESFRAKAWATKHLDVLTREQCPLLRHFVVFSSVSCGKGNPGQSNYGMSNSIMERICERRAAEGLPALAIQWGAVGDVGIVANMQEDNKELVISGTLQQRISSCLQELNGFLKQNRPVVSSMIVAEKRMRGTVALNIVDTVLNIMGLKTLKGVSPIISLPELGMDSMMSVEIKQALEREFEVFLTIQDIRGLSFAKLQEMCDTSKKSSKQTSSDANVHTDLKLIMRLLSSEDINSETCLRLASGEELDKEEVFLVPGMDGMGSVFSSLAKRIRAPATCLQLGIVDYTETSISDMADRLFPHVLKRSKNRRHIIMVGYSFGAAVAIELVRRLEAEGLDGRLILIDGAPDYMKNIINKLFLSESTEELENNFLLSIMNIISSDRSSKLYVNLEECKTWEEKLQSLINHIPSTNLDISVEHQKALFTMCYKRLLAAQSYDCSQLSSIRAPIVLLKPTLPILRSESEDYGLSKVTSNKVEVHYVNGNHATMLGNEKVAAAINEAVEDARS